MPEDLILIGKVVKPHGLRGEVKIISFAESVDTYNNLDRIYLKQNDGSTKPLHIIKARKSKNLVILGLKEIADIESAEGIRGLELFLDRKDMEELPEGEYYQNDLIGFSVFTDAGLDLGIVKDIMPTGSHDLIVVKKGKTEHIIPAIKDVLREVNLKERKLIIEPLEGLLDL